MWTVSIPAYRCGNPGSHSMRVTGWYCVVVQPLSCVRLFATPWAAALQFSLFFTVSQSLLKFMSIELVMPSNRLILCRPFSSCLQSFPASGSLPVSQFFPSGSQSIGVSASASVLPMNTQDWFPSGRTGWISLQSKALSTVFCCTTVRKYQFFGTQPGFNNKSDSWITTYRSVMCLGVFITRKLCWIVPVVKA